MAGCGTVAVESMYAGKHGIFGDIDPLSCLVTKAKTTLQDLAILEALVLDLVEGAESHAATLSEWADLQGLLQATHYSLPNNVQHWFEFGQAAKLAAYLHELNDWKYGLEPEQVTAAEAVFAAATRRLSRADPAPVSCLAVTKVRKSRLEAGTIRFSFRRTFEEKLAVLTAGLSTLAKANPQPVTVVEADAREWALVCRKHDVIPDLAITSPPYCHAIEYWRRHTLETSWLGLLDDDRRRENKRKFMGTTVRNGTSVEEDSLPALCRHLLHQVEDKSDARAKLLLGQYFRDLDSWLRQYGEALEPGGLVMAAVGPNIVRGVPIDTPSVVLALAKEAGFRSVVTSTHAYADTYMQYPTYHGHRVLTESVIRMEAARS